MSDTQQLREEIRKAFESTCDFDTPGHEWDEIWCCQDCMMNQLESLIARERRNAVEEALEKAHLVVDSYDGKYYWGFTEEERESLLPTQ